MWIEGEVVTFTEMIKRKNLPFWLFCSCNTQSTRNGGSVFASLPSLYLHIDNDMRKKAAQWQKNRMLLAPKCRHTCSQNKVAVSLSPISKGQMRTRQSAGTGNSSASPRTPKRAEKEDCTFKVSLLTHDAGMGAHLITPSCALALKVASHGNRRLDLAIVFLTAGGLKSSASLRTATRSAGKNPRVWQPYRQRWKSTL